MYQKIANQIFALGCMTSTQVSNYCHHVLNCGDKSAGGFITQAKKHGLIQEGPPTVIMGKKNVCSCHSCIKLLLRLEHPPAASIYFILGVLTVFTVFFLVLRHA